jgi:hypothetical protein
MNNSNPLRQGCRTMQQAETRALGRITPNTDGAIPSPQPAPQSTRRGSQHWPLAHGRTFVTPLALFCLIAVTSFALARPPLDTPLDTDAISSSISTTTPFYSANDPAGQALSPLVGVPTAPTTFGSQLQCGTAPLCSGCAGGGVVMGLGLAQWRVSDPAANLWLVDTPFRYRASRGPSVTFTLFYKNEQGPQNAVDNGSAPLPCQMQVGRDRWARRPDSKSRTERPAWESSPTMPIPGRARPLGAPSRFKSQNRAAGPAVRPYLQKTGRFPSGNHT